MNKKIIIITLFFIFIVVTCITLNKESDLIEFSSISSGDTQTIAILDTGLDDDVLEANRKNIIGTVNVTNGTENVEDEIGHGTALATLILGYEKMNYKGVLPNVKIVVIKITDESGQSSFQNLLKGLEVAKEYGATIINVSLGGDIPNEAVNKKLQELYEQDVAVLVSSGDYGEKIYYTLLI